MAHSGGGSHSGGSHSSHSSRSSHSSGKTCTRGSRVRYKGSKRYRYKYGGRTDYYYSDRVLKRFDFRRYSLITTCFGLVWSIIAVIACAFMVEYDDNGGLDLSYVDTSIIIEDNADVITDEGELLLRNYLSEFLSETTITVSVVTDYPWDVNDSAEWESYHRYVQMFNDEKHWLIYYIGNDIDRTDDWEWNLMCGDDCVRVLNASQEDKFTKEFHKGLLRDVTFEQAVINALNCLSPDLKPGLIYRSDTYVDGVNCKGQRVNWFYYVFSIWYTGLGLMFLILGLRSLLKPLTDEQISMLSAVEDEPAPVKKYCMYCGSEVTVIEGNGRCSKCGAFITPDVSYK